MFDKRRIRAAYDRAAPGFDAADFLHRDIRERLLDRLRLLQSVSAAVLEGATRMLSSEGEGRGRLRIARRVERAAAELLRERYPGRRLEANVEFYTAVLLDAVGLDRREFTPTFAVGRVAGWCAHILEQRRTGRLIRPKLRYVGPSPELAA